jgi:hypothetical protein
MIRFQKNSGQDGMNGVIPCQKCNHQNPFQIIVKDSPPVQPKLVSHTKEIPKQVVIAHSEEVWSTKGNGLEFEAIPNTPDAIMTAQFGAIPEKSRDFTYNQVHTMVMGAGSVKGENVEFQAATQRIVFEWDGTEIQEQPPRIERITSLINTPSYAVFSGNKSFHLSLYFKPFASNSEEYEDKCFAIYAWLCEQLPADFWFAPDPLNIPTDKLSLVPDFSMWKGGSRWTRQAWGTNTKTNTRQKAIIYHNRHTPLACIDDYSIGKGAV